MYKIISHHGFDFHFPTLEHLFMYLVAIFVSSLEKCVFKESVNLKLIGFFAVELYEFLQYILGVSP